MATTSLSTFLKRLTRGMAAGTLNEQTDRQLVEQFLAQREEAAFEAIVRRHGAMVYRVCWRVLQQSQEHGPRDSGGNWRRCQGEGVTMHATTRKLPQLAFLHAPSEISSWGPVWPAYFRSTAISCTSR